MSGSADIVEIDGAMGSGSGTIVRMAVAMSALTGRPVHIVNARVRRPKPGLRHQHVAAVRACAELCAARVDGLTVGSREIRFAPGGRIAGGGYAWDIGTAGSTTMLALAVLAVAAFADGPVEARMTGGVFQDFAPSPQHLRHVLMPLLGRMGLACELAVRRPGYVPRGAGTVALTVRPVETSLAPLELLRPGEPGRVTGVAVASHLGARRVAERMAATCERDLAVMGMVAAVERVDDDTADQAGASLAIWTRTTTGCLLGADRAGAPRRSAEAIGHHVARALQTDLATGATTDRHVADQLVPFATVAAGTSRWIVPVVTEHVTTNLALARLFGAVTHLDGRTVTVRGLGRRR